jgi:hypothetical protein
MIITTSWRMNRGTKTKGEAEGEAHGARKQATRVSHQDGQVHAAGRHQGQAQGNEDQAETPCRRQSSNR